MSDFNLENKYINNVNTISNLSRGYNVKDYGLIGNGTTDDYTSLNSLLTIVGSSNADLYFPTGTYKLSTSITIPTNVRLIFENGAMLSPDSEKTVTINGKIEAGLYQIFTGSGTFGGTPKIKDVFPEWFGAVGNDSTDDYAALNKSIIFGNGKVPVTLSAKIYMCESKITSSLSNVVIRGQTPNVSAIKSQTLPTVLELTSSNLFWEIKDLWFIGNVQGTGNIKFIKATGAQYLKLINVDILVGKPQEAVYTDYCLWLSGCYYVKAINCKFRTYPTTDTNPHAITGGTCVLHRGTGIYSTNNNAFDITDCGFVDVGKPMYFLNDDGINITGGYMENYAQGIEFDGTASNNTISSIRQEFHPESQQQLLANGLQYSIKFGASTKNNIVNMKTVYALYHLYHPHNMGVIDLAAKGVNIYPRYDAVQSTNPNTCLIQNGNFKYWNGATPVGFTIYGATATKEISDLPSEGGLDSVIRLNYTGNVQGLRTKSFLWNPLTMGKYFTFRFWMKRTVALSSVRVTIWDETNGAYLSSGWGLYSGITKENNCNWDEWNEFIIVDTIGGDDTAKLLRFQIVSDSSPATGEFLVGGLVLKSGKQNVLNVDYSHNDLPFVDWTPTVTWTTATPTGSVAQVARYRIENKICYFNYSYTATDGNDASALDISLPIAAKDNNSIIALASQQKVNTTWTNPLAYIDDDSGGIAFRAFSPCADGSAVEVIVSGFYEIA